MILFATGIWGRAAQVTYLAAAIIGGSFMIFSRLQQKRDPRQANRLFNIGAWTLGAIPLSFAAFWVVAMLVFFVYNVILH